MTTEWAFNGKADKEPLHYNWCGLDDVYLRGGYTRDDNGDVVIEDMDDLHRAIGEHLALDKKTLTGKEIRFLRRAMEASQRCLATILRVTDQTVARWEKGEVLIGAPEELLLRMAYLGHMGGHFNVTELSERISAIDESSTDKEFFEKTDTGWKSAA